ncbi:MAG: hypothetical protein ACOZNI_31865, partial [Myxococcota bacterium]
TAPLSSHGLGSLPVCGRSMLPPGMFALLEAGPLLLAGVLLEVACLVGVRRRVPRVALVPLATAAGTTLAVLASWGAQTALEFALC